MTNDDICILVLIAALTVNVILHIWSMRNMHKKIKALKAEIVVLKIGQKVGFQW